MNEHGASGSFPYAEEAN
ncbi:hypothetical protein PENSOL_c003G11973 [Penicillium solitum]|uniref:Uncharacterized protein n=1 Tax=Penicillium solitum TaxID=60172 RepID=A0A1V6RK52_9EURO|nr:hypothetical protein PENSOL_c003G11973 [Penicillium solitum]